MLGAQGARIHPHTVGPMPRPRNRRDHGRLMHQTEAAKALGMDRQTVLRRAAAGEIETEAVDGTPKVVRASVEAYLARQRDCETVAAA